MVDFAWAIERKPEIILLGTGARQRLLPRPTSVQLMSHGVNIEAMDTQAACRTYNILMAEGRKVAAALLLS